MSRFIKAEVGPNKSVIYSDDAGKYFKYSKGTWTWRNNNPGNIVPGKVSKANGQIGVAGGFAVFPDYQIGKGALLYALKTTFYLMSIDELVKQYAPPKENNTALYIKFIRNKTGITDNRKVKDFSVDEFEKLWQAIIIMEGYKEGEITEFYPICYVELDKQHIISNYFVKPMGWVTKAQCISMAKQGKIDVEICISKLKNIYLRARHGSTFQQSLNKLIIKKNKS